MYKIAVGASARTPDRSLASRSASDLSGCVLGFVVRLAAADAPTATHLSRGEMFLSFFLQETRCR